MAAPAPPRGDSPGILQLDSGILLQSRFVKWRGNNPIIFNNSIVNKWRRWAEAEEAEEAEEAMEAAEAVQEEEEEKEKEGEEEAVGNSKKAKKTFAA